MNASHSTAISILYLSWINEELRKEVELREQFDSDSRVVSRFGSYLVAGVSGIAVLAMKLLDL